LRENLKKPEGIKTLLPVLFTLCLLAPVFPQENRAFLQIQPQLQPERTGISVFFSTVHSGAVREALDQGLESQIFFYIRLYQKAEGLFAFLGDHLIAEYSPWYKGSRDFFNEEYVLQRSDGKTLGFKYFGDFLHEFFTLRDFLLWGMEESGRSGYYVQVMVQLDSVKLVTPFTILSLLSFEGRFSTGWIKKELTP
jgi:hypothetical protein